MHPSEHGYALYYPDPDSSLPVGYQRNGVRIGDVGIVTRDGNFEFLFNVCVQNGHNNPQELPNNFEMLESVDLSNRPYFQPGTHLLSNGVNQTNDS